jgi:hypothetical protein
MFRALLISCLFLHATSAKSATFSFGGSPELNCVMTISGTIEPGDALRFRNFLGRLANDLLAGVEDAHSTRLGRIELGTQRICLDSPGGSVTEAIEMADTLAFGYRVQEITPTTNLLLLVRTLGTAIPDGAECHSACAVLFMAGGFFTPLFQVANVREADRVLHVNGSLGFHAPRLELSGGTYSDAQVAEAFDLAVELTGRLSDRLDRYAFPTSLFTRMMSTSPDSMFYVDNVEQAASWSIQLAGAPRPAAPSFGNIIAMCENMHRLSGIRITGSSQYSTESDPPDIQGETLPLFGLAPQVGFDENEYWRTIAEWLSDGATMTITYSQIGCNVSYDIPTGEADFAEFPPREHGLNPPPARYGWAMFPGYTPIRTLAYLAQRYPDGQVPPDELMHPVYDDLFGECSAYDSVGRLQFVSDCMAQVVARQRLDRTGSDSLMVIDWPGAAAISIRPATGLEPGVVYGEWRYLGALDDEYFNGSEIVLQTPRQLTLRNPRSFGRDSIGGCFEAIQTQEFRCFSFRRFTNRSVSWFSR